MPDSDLKYPFMAVFRLSAQAVVVWGEVDQNHAKCSKCFQNDIVTCSKACLDAALKWPHLLCVGLLGAQEKVRKLEML